MPRSVRKVPKEPIEGLYDDRDRFVVDTETLMEEPPEPSRPELNRSDSKPPSSSGRSHD